MGFLGMVLLIVVIAAIGWGLLRLVWGILQLLWLPVAAVLGLVIGLAMWLAERQRRIRAAAATVDAGAEGTHLRVIVGGRR